MRLLRSLRRWWRDRGFYELTQKRRRNGNGVTFGPDVPDFHYTPWKALRLLGLTEESAGDRVDWAWHDATRQPPIKNAINGRCVDISKSRVEAAQLQAFGYGIAVDPTAHEGLAVRKSEENTAHDGSVVICPLEPAPGFVYQHLIDNQDTPGEVLDLRLMKVGPGWPVGYRKWRLVCDRFINTNTRVEMFDPTSEFTPGELGHLTQACDEVGLDVGEIDVLRDRVSGRIYLIDVNKTPWGPPGGISGRAGRRAMRRMADALHAHYEL